MSKNVNPDQSLPEQPEQKQREQKERRRKLRKRLIILFSSLAMFFLVVVPLALNYFADRIIGSSIREVIRRETNGQYEFSYDKVGFNVFKREVIFNNLQIYPDSALRFSDSVDFPGFIELKIPRMQISGAGALRAIVLKELVIEQFLIGKPTLNLVSGESKTDTTAFQDSIPTQEFDYRRLHTYIEDYLSLLKIRNFHLDSASVVIHHRKPLVDETVELRNFSLQITNFHLDSVSYQKDERIFFSDSLGLTLNDGLFRYRGKMHEISFRHLDVSSSTGKVVVEDVQVIRDTTKLDAKKDGWLFMNIPRVTLDKFDFNSAFGNQLYMDEITIDNPEFVYHPPRPDSGSYQQSREYLARRFFESITAYFDPLEIGEINLNNGKLKFYSPRNKSLHNFSIPDFTVVLHHLWMDPANYDQRSLLFFIDDLKFISKNQTISIEKSGIGIVYEKLDLDTKSNTLIVDNLTLEKSGDTKATDLDISLPKLSLVSKSLKNDFLNNALSLRGVELKNPEIKIRSGKAKTKTRKVDIYNLYPEISQFLKWINVDIFKITNANIDFENKKKWNPEKFTASNVDVAFTDFRLDDQEKPDDRIFYASSIACNFGDVTFMQPADNRIISADNVLIDTKTSSATLHNLKLDTIGGSLQSKRLEDGVLVFELAGANFSGVDFHRLYHQKGIFIDSAQILQPEVSLFGNAFAGENAKTKKPAALASDYYIGHTTIEGGRFAYAENIRKKTNIEVQQFDFSFNNLKPADSSSNKKIDITGIEAALGNISATLPDGVHRITLKKMYLSSTDSLIRVDNFNLETQWPVSTQEAAINIRIPEFMVTSVALLKLYHFNEIEAGSILFDSPVANFQPSQNKQGGSFLDFDSYDIKRALLKVFSSVDVDLIEIAQADIDLKSDDLFNPGNFHFNNFNFSVADLSVDSSSTMSPQNLLFAGDIRLTIDGVIIINSAKGEKITMEDVAASTASGFINIASLKYMQTENGSLDHADEMDFGKIGLTGIDYFKLLNDKKLELAKIEVSKPVFILNRENQTEKSNRKTHEDLNIYSMISAHLYEFKTGDVVIDSARVKINDHAQKQPKSYILDRVNFELKNILIDSANRVFENKFLYSDDLNFTAWDYHETSSDSLYDFGAHRIAFSGRKALLEVDSGFLTPNFNDTIFAAKVGTQTDRLDLAFNKISLKNIRLMELIFNNTLRIDNVELVGLTGNDYKNKAFPLPENHFPLMPVQALRSLDMKLRVDTFLVYNSEFTYREYIEPALMPGRIYFSDINLAGRNITNNADKIERDSLMRFYASAKMMGEGKLELQLDFNLKSKDDEFSANGIVNQFDLTHLNPILENIAFVKIKRGYNEMLHFNLSANGELATGNMHFDYNKLQIRLIDKKTLLDKGFGESIASFIANTFVVRRSNPQMIFSFRNGDIYFRRNKSKSFFNYLTKSTLSGVQSTIRGGNEERKEKRKKQQMERRVKSEGKLDEYNEAQRERKKGK